MSENREETNWDSAQQTHREIQEEILHSRNLELFDDVERLLPRGKFPTCVEQEMPVDPWDPADQKLRTKLPGSQAVAGPKRARPDTASKSKTDTKSKKPRGHEIPDDAHDGFLSVAELLKRKSTTAKGKKQTRIASAPLSDEGSEGSVDDELVLFGQKISGTGRKRARNSLELSEHDSEAENELLYGTISKGKAKAQPAVKARGKAVQTEATRKPKKPKVVKAKETETEEKERVEREEMNQRAVDFFNTLGPTRKRAIATASPTPPSSPPFRSPAQSTRPPPSPIAVKHVEAASRPVRQAGNKLSPATAALVGFSQVDAIDLSWDDQEVVMSGMDSPGVSSRPGQPIGLTKPTALQQTRSAQMMPPPPVPSRPAANLGLFDSPFAIRPGPSHRLPASSSPTRNGIILNSTSPSSYRDAAGPGRAAADSSPLIPVQRRQRRPKIHPDRVRPLVSPSPRLPPPAASGAM